MKTKLDTPLVSALIETLQDLMKQYGNIPVMLGKNDGQYWDIDYGEEIDMVYHAWVSRPISTDNYTWVEYSGSHVTNDKYEHVNVLMIS